MHHHRLPHAARFTLLGATLTLVACGGPGEAFLEGLPSEDMVRMDVPGGTSSQGLKSSPQTLQQGLEGQTAALYQLTRGVTVAVNGGTLAVLGLVKAVTRRRPTSLQDNVAVWGPHTAALSPNTWKLTVTDDGNDDYSYVLEGKAKSAEDSAYVAVLSGTHHRDGAGLGSGTLLIDWNNAHSLPENDGIRGTATLQYSRVSESAVATIDVQYAGVRKNDDAPVDATYHFAATPGAGGEFSFAAKSDVDGQGAQEDLLIKSRWQESGAGRSDVRATNGDAPAGATASECWDSNFASRYVNISFAPSYNYGDEATACVFTTADFVSP